jgi:hypothetical protein
MPRTKTTKKQKLMQMYHSINMQQANEMSESEPNQSFIEICQTVKRVILRDLDKCLPDFSLPSD